MTKGRKPTGRKPVNSLKTARLNLMVTPRMRREMHAYANRHYKSLSSVITAYFEDLLRKENIPDVEQI